jgi:hypothetical protein
MKALDDVLVRELESYRRAMREAFDEGFALSKLQGPIEAAWERSEARHVEAQFTETVAHVRRRLERGR